MSNSGGFPDLKTLIEIKDLIDKVAKVEHDLAENERVLFHELRDKYANEVSIGFEDKVLLEVMLRNITVRRNKGVAS